MNTDIAVSVIIATYNRAYILGECLESLACQAAEAEAFEVIVVDNNSTDNTEELVASFSGSVPNLLFIKEPRQGLSFARNAGMAVARGAWAACLDSDAKADSNWIEVILREVASDQFDCFGGPYRAWHRFGPAPTWFSAEWETTTGNFAKHGLLAAGMYPSGGNCAFRKKLVASMGGFPTNIGMTGTRCAYGEETKLFRVMREAGARIGSVPDLLIDHCVLPYKYGVGWRLRSAYAIGRDAPDIFSIQPSPRSLAGAAWRVLRACLWGAPIKCLHSVRCGHEWQRVLLESLGPVLSSWGTLQRLVVLGLRLRHFDI